METASVYELLGQPSYNSIALSHWCIIQQHRVITLVHYTIAQRYHIGALYNSIAFITLVHYTIAQRYHIGALYNSIALSHWCIIHQHSVITVALYTSIALSPLHYTKAQRYHIGALYNSIALSHWCIIQQHSVITLVQYTWVVPKVRRQSQPYIFQCNLRAETYFMIYFNEYERFI